MVLQSTAAGISTSPEELVLLIFRLSIQFNPDRVRRSNAAMHSWQRSTLPTRRSFSQPIWAAASVIAPTPLLLTHRVTCTLRAPLTRPTFSLRTRFKAVRATGSPATLSSRNSQTPAPFSIQHIWAETRLTRVLESRQIRPVTHTSPAWRTHRFPLALRGFKPQVVDSPATCL